MLLPLGPFTSCRSIQIHIPPRCPSMPQPRGVFFSSSKREMNTSPTIQEGIACLQLNSLIFLVTCSNQLSTVPFRSHKGRSQQRKSCNHPTVHFVPHPMTTTPRAPSASSSPRRRRATQLASAASDRHRSRLDDPAGIAYRTAHGGCRPWPRTRARPARADRRAARPSDGPVLDAFQPNASSPHDADAIAPAARSKGQRHTAHGTALDKETTRRPSTVLY